MNAERSLLVKRDRLFEELNIRLNELNQAKRRLRYANRRYRVAWDAWIKAASECAGRDLDPHD